MKNGIVIETERLLLRKLTPDDFSNLCTILQDAEAMVAYNGAFSDQEVLAWLERQLYRYRTDGIGLYAVLLKKNHAFIGQCGLTMQTYNDKRVMEVGYLFCKEYWHQGFATEAARACKDFAFQTLKVDEVCSIIRDSNLPSIQVALRNGMKATDHFIKVYRGEKMPHTVYTVQKETPTIVP